VVFLDIETNSKHTNIWCVATKLHGNVQVHYDSSSLVPLVQDQVCVAHNGIAFDFYLLGKLWGVHIPHNMQRDTLVMSRLVKPDLEDGHSLDAWGKRLGVLKGSYDNWDNPDMALLVEYNKQDVEVLEKLYTNLETSLKRLKFSKKSVELEHEVADILAEQQRNGWMLDVPHATTLLATLEDRQQTIIKGLQKQWQPKVQARVSEKTGKRLKDKVVEFNVNSRDHIAERLVELGWKPTAKTPSGKWIVDEGTLDGVDIPEAKLVNESLMLTKRISQLKSWLELMYNLDYS
jgi:DNA polymerase-1